MHLTEVSRFVDATQGKYVTNDTHFGTLETLCRLVISLTILPKSRSESRFFSTRNPFNIPSELYKHSLIALCGMVVHNSSYVAQDAPKQESVTLEAASRIATAVLASFELNDLVQYQTFLTETDMLTRGEEVEIHGFLHSLS